MIIQVSALQDPYLPFHAAFPRPFDASLLVVIQACRLLILPRAQGS